VTRRQYTVRVRPQWRSFQSSKLGLRFVSFNLLVPMPAPDMTTLYLKNDTDVAHYNFSADQPILIIFGTLVAESVCYQTVICYPTSPN